MRSDLALAYLLNALWQLPLLLIAGLAGERVLARTAPAWRHGLWLAVAAACSLLPAFGAAGAHRAVPPLAILTGDRGVMAAPDPRLLADWLAADRRAPAPSLGSLMLWVWAALVAQRVRRLAHAHLAARRLVRGAQPLSPAEGDRLRNLVTGREAALSIRQAEIRVAVGPCAPITVGWWQPVVVLPEGFLASAPADVWAALAHELAHVRRHDYAINLLCELLLLPVSFHPATATLRRRLAIAREVACDEAAVAVLGRRTYARSLLAFAATAAGLTPPSHALSVVDDARTLEVRLKKILDTRPRLRRGPAGASLAVAALLLAVIATLAALFSVRADASAGDAPSGDGELAAFVGTWRGAWPADPKDGNAERRPALDLHISAEGIIHELWWRYEKTAGGSIRATKEGRPVAAYRIAGSTLFLTQRLDDFSFRDEPPAAVVIEESFELQGGDAAVFRVLSNSYFAARARRGEAVPPPPPPILMKRGA